MKRRLFQFAAVISLLLFIVSVSTWFLSYARFAMLGAESGIREGRQFGGTVNSIIGSIQITIWKRQYLHQLPASRNGGFTHMSQPYMTGSWSSRLGRTKVWGFTFSRTQNDTSTRLTSDGKPMRNETPQTVWSFILPHWAL